MRIRLKSSPAGAANHGGKKGQAAIPFRLDVITPHCVGRILEYEQFNYAMGGQMVDSRSQKKIEFRQDREVRWAETCGLCDIHHSQWLRYMEEAEYAFLRSRGLSVVLADERGQIGFPRLACQLDIHGTASAGQMLTTKLILDSIDGKQIAYSFRVLRGDQLLANGRFQVACCRFPPDSLPYAILIPDWVMAKLVSS